MSAMNFETLGTVLADGTLELDETPHVPPGRVKVRLEVLESPTQAHGGLVEFVQGLRDELAAAGHVFRTKEEIDAEIAEMRDEWDADEDQTGP